MHINKISAQNFGQIYTFNEARKYLVIEKKKLPLLEQVNFEQKIDDAICTKFMDVYYETNGDIYAKDRINGRKFPAHGDTPFERFMHALDIAIRHDNAGIHY